MRSFLLLALSLIQASCAYYSPFIDPTKDEQTSTSGRDFSLKQQKKLISEANSLSNANLYATTALAGTLGLGGYKVLTGGSGHHIAALATGSGVIYGYQQSLYNETISGILLSGAATLACIDGAYSMPSAKQGEELMRQLKIESPSAWNTMESSYLQAVAKINLSNNHYISNIKKVVYSTNIRRASLQLSTRQSYDFLTTSIAVTKPVTVPSDQTLKNSSKTDTKVVTKNNGLDSTGIDLFKQAKILELLAKLREWIRDVDAAAMSFTPDEILKCKTTSSPPVIYGVGEREIVALPVGSTKSLKIANTSGNLTTSSNGKNSSGSNYVETKVITDSGNYFLEVTGKITTTTPVTVFVTDVGKEEATTAVQFTVN